MMRITILLITVAIQISYIQCGLSSTPINIDEKAKRGIVNEHNYLRRLEGDAANMKEMSWDDELARRCENIVMSCKPTPDNDLIFTSNFHANGENLLWAPLETQVNEHSIEMAVSEWHAQDWDQQENKKESRPALYQQYLRLVWAENDKVGCSAAVCPMSAIVEGEIEAKFMCCAYGPVQVVNESQYEDPKNIFIQGDRCSKCDADYECSENLCVPCNSSCPTDAPSTTTANANPNTVEVKTTAPVSSTTSGSTSYRRSCFALPSAMFIAFILCDFINAN